MPAKRSLLPRGMGRREPGVQGQTDSWVRVMHTPSAPNAGKSNDEE
jgi:hypothetical protein